MTSNTTLTIVDGVKVVVPDSLNLITPYVLQEQEDWFEDEIKFLRKLLQPGANVIDIGANYGVYTLSMAKTVGSNGRVWAFEPASSTASLLAQGIAANGFSQVVLEQSALSNHSGTAQLSLNDNSELNSLVHGQAMSGVSETVPLVTLDECRKRFGWDDIAFIKIDAEGEEVNILNGGGDLLKELSPLIQYEIKAGAEMNLDLISHFEAIGYESYRLIPGLDVLVPFDADSQPDIYLLNLFCCKKDCAEKLAARGYLLQSETLRSPATSVNVQKRFSDFDTYHWRQTIGNMPYGGGLVEDWQQTVELGDSTEVEKALFLYRISQDLTVPLAERFCALETAFSRLADICEQSPSYLRLASLARVALEYGARGIAVGALDHLSKKILQENEVDPNEPFLAPLARFDFVVPGEVIGNWVLAGILEALEQREYYSSYYSGSSTLKRLEIIRAVGLGSTEMGRRLNLVRQRLGLFPR